MHVTIMLKINKTRLPRGQMNKSKLFHACYNIIVVETGGAETNCSKTVKKLFSFFCT